MAEVVYVDEFYDRVEVYRRIFELCDRDEDGYISIEELADFLSNNENYRHYLRDDVVKKTYAMIQNGDNRKMSIEQFISLIEDVDFGQRLQRYVNRYIRFLIPQPKPPTLSLPLYAVDGRIRLRTYLKSAEITYTCYPPQLFLVLISMLEIICFVIDEETKGRSSIGAAATIFVYDPWRRHEAWRFLTYMLVHIGLV